MPDPIRPQEDRQLRSLAELIVRFGANVQPGQIVALSSEPGKEALARAVAEVAYEAGAKFVDLSVFDVHMKRSRALHAPLETLGFVPPWYGERLLALGEHRCARVVLSGPVAPTLMSDVEPARLGLDMLPAARENIQLVNAQTTNWTIAPCPVPGWAEFVYPDLEPEDALARLWEQIFHACRIDEENPVAAWRARLDSLIEAGQKLDRLELDALRFEGPGTDLTVGLLPASRWRCGHMTTVDGIEHAPNLPTEEVFTTPDPARTEGVVRSTKPLMASGALITGLRVRFERGRAVEFDADQGGEALAGLAARDEGASRLGEVALVDRQGRIGPMDTTFFDTLLDENAASHIALGQGVAHAVEDEGREQMNHSEIHIDFMIGGNDVAVTGVTRDGAEVPLLRGGDWQI